MSHRFLRALPFLLLALAAPLTAQDRLKEMPGYAQYTEMAPKLGRSFASGAIAPRWADGGGTLEYTTGGTRWRYDLTSRHAAIVPVDSQAAAPGGGRRMGGVARGRQATEAWSPDSSMKAVYRDRNLFVSMGDGAGEQQLTTDGGETARIKYGTASWVYGEELRQTTAMWWSPDGKRLAFYRFDENPVKDYVLQMDQTKVQGAAMIEAYPKAGTGNPVVDLYVYDASTGKVTTMDVRFGRPFTDDVVGHYVYGITWSPDGSELLMNRTNRRQNIMEFTACRPDAGACRVILREEWAASWTENSPTIRWLEDGKRFIWASERTGFSNYSLYHISGKLLTTLTNHPFEVTGIVKVDERAGQLWYTARSGDNYMKVQLHRVGLNGTGDRRLTDPVLNHTVSVSPDGKFITDVAQTHAIPPVTRLLNANGRVLDTLATSDLTAFHTLGLEPVEMFTFTAADGATPLQGMLHKPHDFDPAKRYPVIFSVYAGPGHTGAREVWSTPNPLTEYGFLVVTVDTRAAAGKGKRSLDAIYQKFGQVEIDDIAAASRHLATRPYVAGDRVGIYGTSYGGYASAMALLRHPDAFHAASASSSVTAWDHYDTIYTERYMYTPQANPEAYKLGSAMEYAKDLKGRLMIYYGTADDNVHPNNSMQLIKALQAAGKSFEVQVGPDAGHTGLNAQRMMEFFIEALVLEPNRLTT